MQYLLTEDEMAAIREERRLAAEQLPGRSMSGHLEALKNVCQHVATTMIPTVEVNGAKTEGPHGCIHVADPRGSRWQAIYCDMCQVAGICPQPKNWSK